MTDSNGLACSSSSVLAGRLVATPFLDIQPQRVAWLWTGRVPLSSLTIVCGPAGLGKTLLALRLSADCSRGVLVGDLEGRPAAALIVAGEDPASSVLRPRLGAADADLNLVHHVASTEGRVTFPDDVPALAELVASTGARLVIIDPITSVLRADASPNSEHDVRRSLEPLIAAADTHDFAVLGIQHRNKSRDHTGLERLLGSTAWGALARTVLEVQVAPGDPLGQARALVPLKANLGPCPSDLLFDVEPASVVGDDGELIPTGRAVLQDGSSSTAPVIEAAPALSSVARLILGILPEDGSDNPADLREIGDRLADLGRPRKRDTILRALGELALADLIDESTGGWWRVNGRLAGVSG